MLATEINPNEELWLSEVEAPQIITDPNLFAWDDEADLVVAGLGALELLLPMKPSSKI